MHKDLLGKQIQTVCLTYGGYHKDQAQHLHKIPTGTIGTVRAVIITSNDEYVLVRFLFEDRIHWAKLGPTTFKPCTVLEPC